MDEQLAAAAAKVVAPFVYPAIPEARIFGLYLLTAALLAVGVYLYRRPGKSGGSTLKGFLTFCFPASVYRHPSAVVDYKFFIINKISYAFLFAPWLLGAAAVAEVTDGALTSLFAGPDLAVGVWSTALFTVLAILAMDLGLFVAHTLQHKVPVLWEFHKVHHSAEVMTPITVYRMHPLDDLLSGTFVALLTGAVEGGFLFLHDGSVSVVSVFGLNLFLFLFYLVGYNLRHSHIWLPYPRALSRYLVSPAQHQIHHSKAPRHWDRNMGFIFAFWDRMAGTLYVPEGREEIEFGLHRDEHKAFDSVWNLYVRPFKALAARRRAISDANP